MAMVAVALQISPRAAQGSSLVSLSEVKILPPISKSNGVWMMPRSLSASGLLRGFVLMAVPKSLVQCRSKSSMSQDQGEGIVISRTWKSFRRSHDLKCKETNSNHF